MISMNGKHLFDNNFIKRVLQIYKFGIFDFDVSKISYVHMNDCKFSSKNNPFLLTINLQCCVAVYLCGNGFGFLAHINTTKGNLSSLFFDVKNNDFLLSDLVLEELRSCCEYIGKNNDFYIGIVLGSNPYPDDYYVMDSINKGINNLIKNASFYGINVQLNDRIILPDFIMDTQNSEFISANVKIKIR